MANPSQTHTQFAERSGTLFLSVLFMFASDIYFAENA